MDQNTLKQGQSARITNSSSFHRPLEATYKDEPVKVTHVGDAEGMSPVCLVIDAEGRSAWVRQSDLQFTDQELFTPSGVRSSSKQQPAIAGR